MTQETASALPPHIAAAKERVLAAIQEVNKAPLDTQKLVWADVEKAVIPLLGGAFQMARPEHQVVALGLSALFSEGFMREDGAFWFPHRDMPEGAALGFPAAMIMLSPLGAVVDSLSQAKLPRLEDIQKEVRQSLAQVKFSAAGGQAMRLSPVDYQRLFDPGLVQLVAVDATKVTSSLSSPPDKLARDLREAVSRSTALPQETKAQLEAQLVGGLQRLNPGQPLVEQLSRAPRLGELVVHLSATVAFTPSAPEELWADIVFPLLHVGAPDGFPPVDPEVAAAAEQGVAPLFLFLEEVPYREPAPEDGPLGAFAVDELSLLHPAFQAAQPLRLMKIQSERVQKLLAAFEPAKTKDALARYVKHLETTSGKKVRPSEEADQLLEGALTVLTELKKASTQGTLCLRRLTEAEAHSEPALAEVRKSLSGPRIILT